MKKFIFLSATICIIASSHAQVKPDTLLTKFQKPPDAAKPRVWWHWMNGNITKDGIRKDLEWMKRSGIGGFQNFDAAMATPQIVEKRLTYMTPEWKDAFLFTTKLADSLKLEMAIAGSPGWSESGGPWVKPEDGMKKIVWTETRVKGGATNMVVPKQSGITGPFQDLDKQPGFGDAGVPKDLPLFYKDIAIVAVKLPEADKSLIGTQGGGYLQWRKFYPCTVNRRRPWDNQSAAYRFCKRICMDTICLCRTQTIKAVTMVGGGNKGPFGLLGSFADTRSLETSDDGINFKRVCYIPAGNVLQQTISTPATTAKYFRVTVKNPPAPVDLGGMFGAGGAPPKPPLGTDIGEIVLHTASRINMFEEKDAFAPSPDLYSKANTTADDVVSPADIIDLTGKINTDGTLNWTVPAGNWKIIRFGYSLMGITNHPASPEATGWKWISWIPLLLKNISIIILINTKAPLVD